MKLFQRTAKDGNELGDLLEPEKKPRKAASERADGKDLLPGIGASLLGVAAAGALLWFGVFGGAGEAQQRQLDAAWAEGQAGALRQALQQLAADTSRRRASPSPSKPCKAATPPASRPPSAACWPGTAWSMPT